MARTIVDIETGDVTFDDTFQVDDGRETLSSTAAYEDAIQALVDETARARQFRDGVTLASYVLSTNTQWASEAQAFIAWRDAVWAFAYQELQRVKNGGRGQPTVHEFIDELPSIDWP